MDRGLASPAGLVSVAALAAGVACGRSQGVPDEALGELCIEHLDRIKPGVRDRYIGCRVMRVPLAYPIYRLDYEPRREQFAESTGIEGLYSVGRNGEFGHWLMEDVYWRTRRRIRPLLDKASRVTL